MLLFERYHRAQTEESVLGLARAVSLDLRRGMDLSDARRLFSFIQDARGSDPRIISLTIADASGEITGDLEEGRVFSRTEDSDILAVLDGKGGVERWRRPTRDLLVATVPIHFPGSGEVLGALQVRYDVSSIEALYRRARVAVVSVVAAMALLLLGLLGAALRGSVVRPLQALSRQVEEMAHGNLSVRIGPQSVRELHLLEGRFNDMARSLEGSLSELRRHRATLEAEVASRTADLRSAKAQLEELNADLEARIEERTGQLLHAERLAAIGTLASGLAHEINNPMATILACAQGLERTMAESGEDLPEPLLRKLRDYLPMISEEAARCRGLTTQLLDFSRRGRRRMTEMDLRRVMADAAALIEPRAAAERKSLRLEAGGAPIPVRGDSSALMQVVVNILINALDASGEGGEVELTGGVRAGSALLQVLDRGCGMSPEELARALEPFVTTKGPSHGTGLGLTICDMIVHEHGGRILLESEGPGKGTKVTVSLPLSVPAGEART